MLKECITYLVFVASPDDCNLESEQAYQAVLHWNLRYTPHTRRVMLPRRWTKDAIPMGGGDPQDLLNEQLLAGSDILVAIFKHELGASGGTEREVRFFIEKNQGRRVMLFFHRDAKREPALQRFLDEMKSHVFYTLYSSADELTDRIQRALLERAETSRAAKPVEALRITLTLRVREWNQLERSGPNSLEQAFAILDLINAALEEFMKRDIGLALGVVDQPVRACAAKIRMLVRDAVSFIDRRPWDESDGVIGDVVRLLQDLPEEEDLL